MFYMDVNNRLLTSEIELVTDEGRL